MKTKYGYYSSTQINSVKSSIQKNIFFLLLYVDPKTKDKYPNINVPQAFHSLQKRLNGLNSILLEPPVLVKTMSLLEAALIEYQSDEFDWKSYRKLILDAGTEIMSLKEGGSDGNQL